MGNRIGFGAGYYDRYFFEYPNPNLKKVAIAYDFQIEEELQAEQFDVPIHRIVTERRQVIVDDKGN
jgi:5-formyltetrahydrofolate cyclo-ligase